MDGYSSGGAASWLSASGSAPPPVAVGRQLLITGGLPSRNDRSEDSTCAWVGAPVTGSGVVGSRDKSMPEMTRRAVMRALSWSVVKVDGSTGTRFTSVIHKLHERSRRNSCVVTRPFPARARWLSSGNGRACVLAGVLAASATFCPRMSGYLGVTPQRARVPYRAEP